MSSFNRYIGNSRLFSNWYSFNKKIKKAPKPIPDNAWVDASGQRWVDENGNYWIAPKEDDYGKSRA